MLGLGCERLGQHESIYSQSQSLMPPHIKLISKFLPTDQHIDVVCM